VANPAYLATWAPAARLMAWPGPGTGAAPFRGTARPRPPMREGPAAATRW